MELTQQRVGKDFHLVIIGQIISVFGSALVRFVLSLYVLELTGRTDLFATMFAFSNLPLLLAPIGSVLADRFQRTSLMILFDVMNSGLVFLFLFILSMGKVHFVIIGAVMVLLALISAFYTPTVTASIPLLVPAEKLEGANRTVQAVQALSNIAGPVIGGILYGIAGIQTVIIFSATAFLFSAIMELFIRVPVEEHKWARSVSQTVIADLKEGASCVVRDSLILKAIVTTIVLNLVLSPFLLIGGPVILRDTLNCSNQNFGLAMGVISVGTIAGAVANGYVAKYLTAKRLFQGTLLITFLFLPLSLSAIPMVKNTTFALPVFLFSATAIAMIVSALSIFIITKIQKRISNQNLGKILAIITAAAQCAAPIGQIFYGKFFEFFDNQSYLPVMMIGLIMIGVSLFIRKIFNEKDFT